MKKILCVSIVMAMLCAGCGSETPPPNTNDSSVPSETVPIKSTAKVAENSPTESAQDIYDRLLEYLNLDYAYDPEGTFAVSMKNDTSKIVSIMLQITARDKDNKIIATDSLLLDDIFPNRPYYRAYNSPIHEEAVSIEFEITEAWMQEFPDWYNEDFLELTVENVSLQNNNETITGEIRNDNDFDIPEQLVYLIFRDDNGNIVPQRFAYLTYTSEIKAHSSVPFQVDTFLDLSQKNYSISVELST